MTGTRIEGEEFRGVLRLTWEADHLSHVLAHSQADEPAGVWTGQACLDNGLLLGGDVDSATLRELSAHGGVADLAWEPSAELAAEHGQLCRAAIQAHLAGARETGERLWQQAQALWSLAWAADYQALGLLQEVGLTQFSPVKPQRWVVASFDHHRGPHGLPHPHIHNIVITGLTSTSPASSGLDATVPFGKLSFSFLTDGGVSVPRTRLVSLCCHTTFRSPQPPRNRSEYIYWAYTLSVYSRV